VAAHSLGAALVALALGPRVRPELDVDRAAALLVVHDAPEALLGDLSHAAAELLPAGAKAEAEARAAELLLAPLSSLAHARSSEYAAGESREARFARLCDKLQLGVRLVGYQKAGAGGLAGFRRGLAALDCAEFAPCEDLRAEILAALDGAGPGSE
jgi:putative hydrolase of HD superfamily